MGLLLKSGDSLIVSLQLQLWGRVMGEKMPSSLFLGPDLCSLSAFLILYIRLCFFLVLTVTSHLAQVLLYSAALFHFQPCK